MTSQPPLPAHELFQLINWIIGSPAHPPQLPDIPLTLMTSVTNPSKHRYAQTPDSPSNLAYFLTQLDLLPANWWKYTLKAVHTSYPTDLNTPQQRLSIVQPFFPLDFVLTRTTKKHPSHLGLHLGPKVKYHLTPSSVTLKVPITDQLYKLIAMLTHNVSIECPFGATLHFFLDSPTYTIKYTYPDPPEDYPPIQTLFLRSACQILPRLFHERSPIRRFVL